MSHAHCAVAILAVLAVGVPAATAVAQTAPPAKPDDPPSGSVTRDMYKDMKLGKLNIHGDNAVIEALILQRNIPVSYEYVASLLRAPNAFGAGPACIVCHGSNDPARSYRGLDLSTCEGILRGATEDPARVVVVPKNPDKSVLVHMLLDNRMPLGVAFSHPVDTDSINTVRDWINGGAKNDDNFQKKVLPLFSSGNAFGGSTACVDCHQSFRDPPSFNEVNLSSYEAIMRGAFSTTRGKAGKPSKPIVVPFDAAESPLYLRLTRNRMPPGVDPGHFTNHPNILLLSRWVEQGAWCK
jgi:cytochrome c553